MNVREQRRTCKEAPMVIAKQSHAVTCKCVCQSLSRVRLFATTWTVARQASLSMGFSRQEYWSGLPFPSPEDLPDPGIEPWSPALSYCLSYREAQDIHLQGPCVNPETLRKHLSSFRSLKLPLKSVFRVTVLCEWQHERTGYSCYQTKLPRRMK